MTDAVLPQRHGRRKPGLATRRLAWLAPLALAGLGATQGCEKLNVTVAEVITVTVTPDPVSLMEGQTHQLAATLEDEAGRPLSGRSISWTSQAPGIASVDEAGLVTALAEGQTLIQASADGVTGSAAVTVTPGPRIELSRTEVEFEAVEERGDPFPVAVFITNVGAGTLSGLSADVTHTQGAGGWLAATLDGSTAPTTVTLSVATTGLLPGNYGAVVSVVAEGARNSPQTIQVDLTLERGPAIGLSATSVWFQADPGGADPAPQAVQVTNTGGFTLSGLSSSIEYVAGAASWLSADLTGTTAPTTLNLQASMAGLGAGTYVARVSVKSGAATNSPQTLDVTLEVQAAPRIALSATTAEFVASAGGEAVPSGVTIDVTNGGSGALTGLFMESVEYAPSQPSGWLSAELASSEAPTTLELSAEAASLGAGAYQATVTLLSPVAGNSPQTVTVTLTVSDLPLIGLNPGLVVFSATQGDASPPQQAVAVTNQGTGALEGLTTSIRYGFGEPTGWLLAVLEGQTAPTSLSLQALVGTIAAGVYTAHVDVASPAAGNSPRSVLVRLAVSPPAPDASPSDLSATATSPTTIALSWDDNASNEAGYAVERCQGTAAACTEAQFQEIARTGANAFTHEDTGLSPATTYAYRVRAFNDGGTSGYSNVAEATTDPPPAPDGAPTALSAAATSDSTIDLAWVDNSTNEDGFDVERCDVQPPAACADGDFALLHQTGPDEAVYQDTGRAELTRYTYRVRAFNPGGASAHSNEAAATTPLAAPSTLTVTGTTASSVDLSWTDRSLLEDGYRIERCTGTAATCTEGDFAEVGQVGTEVSVYTDGTVVAGTTYAYRIRAYRGAYFSAYSNEAEATAAGSAPDGDPTDLTVVGVTTSTVDLSWTDNSSNEEAFEVERCQGAACSGFVFVGQSAAGVTTFQDGGVSEDATYRYRVRATNAGGNSGYSNVAEATTPLAAPTDLIVTGTTATSVSLAWTDNSAVEEGVRVQRCQGNMPSCKDAGFSDVAQVAGVDVTSFTDTTAEPSTVYSYRVRAYRGATDSDPSNEVQTSTPAPAPPPGVD